MSYLVLARRWRPQTFEDLIGQEHVGQTLQNAVKNQRIAHAYLFSGSRGVGKTTSARLLAKALNCQNGPTAVPCNTCASCRSITEGNSLDVLEIDGASNRGIEEIRELREGIRYLPSQSRYRVIIIDEVHMLTKEAFNALLKTLEEPPPHVVFIFATTEVNKIPITILSRCQHFPFRLIPVEKIVKRLSLLVEHEENKVSQGCLHLIARQAGGSMRDAESLLDQILALGQAEISEKEILSILGLVPRDVCYNFVENLIERKAADILETIRLLVTQGSDLRAFARDLLECARSILLVKAMKQPSTILELPPEELNRLQELALKSSREEIFRLAKIFSELELQIKESSFQRFALELTCLKIVEMPPIRALDELMERLQNVLKVLSFPESENPQGPATQKSKAPTPIPASERETKSLPYPISEKQEKPQLLQEQERTGIQENVVASNEPKMAWQGIIDLLRERSNGALESVLRQAEAESFQDDTLVINFSKSNSFFLDKFHENRLLICEVASDFFGKKIKVELHADLLKPKSKGIKRHRKMEPAAGQYVAEREESVHETTAGNGVNIKSSLLQDALEIFGGSIVIP